MFGIRAAASLIACAAACGHAAPAGGAPPPALDWSLPDVRVAQAYAGGGTLVILTLDGAGRLALVDAATGAVRMRAQPPPGVHWEEGIALADAVLVEGKRGSDRIATAFDISTGKPRWTIPLGDTRLLEPGPDGTGIGRMQWGGDCVGDVLDHATGSPLAKGIRGIQIRQHPPEGSARFPNEHWFSCGPAITILGASRGRTFAMFHHQGLGLHVVDAHGPRRLAETAGGEVLEAGRAGDVAWGQTYNGLFVVGIDMVAARVRWQRSFSEQTCGYRQSLEEPACGARLVTVAGRAPFLLLTTGVTTTALAPTDGRVLWTHTGPRDALVVIAGDVRADEKGQSQRAFGTRLGTRWLDADGRVLGEVPPPEPKPYHGRQIPIGDDAVLRQGDGKITVVGRDGNPRWSGSPAGIDSFVDDVADGCALLRVEDFSTRHLRFIDLRNGHLVTEIRDVEPVLALIRAPGQPTRIVLQRMKGGLMSVRSPCSSTRTSIR